MTGIMHQTTRRRAVLGGLATGGALLTLSGCSSLPGYSMVDAVQRILFLSSDRAFSRMLAADGFWDRQVAQFGLASLLGTRGDVLGRILTGPLFKSRLENAFGGIAYDAAERAAPLVTEAVRTVGIQNAIDLVRGGPTAATTFLRGAMGQSLVEAMVPEVGQAMRVARDPLMGQVLAALTGVDIPQVADGISGRVNDIIWDQIGIEERAIRANPQATRDPLIIGVFGAGAAL